MKGECAPCWPPKPGDAVYFYTPAGIQSRVLREVSQGLVWKNYILEDGRFLQDLDFVMCPEVESMRHPATVTLTELRQAESHIRAKLDVGQSVTSEPAIWAEFLQYVTFEQQKTRAPEDAELQANLPEIREDPQRIM
jgi:hypothetical protein